MKMVVFITFILLTFAFSACVSEKTETPPIKNIAGVEREVFDVKKYPALTAVGKISFIGQKWCSAILISEDIVVTAGHCFLERKGLDLSKDFDELYIAVSFRPDGRGVLENIRVKRVLKASMNPDYAIVKLNRKVTEIKPLKISKITLEEMREHEKKLGCAGYNGDKELGDEGWTMTISRNIKIIPETSSADRVDVNCFSFEGGSGGLLFEEKYNVETNANEYDLIGVIWGLTDGKYNEKGEFIKDDTMITSITPVSVFYDELTEIIREK